jgi:Flp pilus assembly protein CpaB
MNRTRPLVIGIVALVLGAVLSSFVYQSLQAKMARQKVGVDVVVAANDIQVGAKIGEGDLKVVTRPKICLAVSFTRKRLQSGAALCFLSTRGNL